MIADLLSDGLEDLVRGGLGNVRGRVALIVQRQLFDTRLPKDYICQDVENEETRLFKKIHVQDPR